MREWYSGILLSIATYYLMLGAFHKDVPRPIKIVIFLFVIGTVFIVMALILLLPGSSDIIAELLK
ncbi:hypothetical protein [Bacillus sp. SD088]|uniref:hypothetical protein n=1 Tax=Bacillus sp. SD088 TaxID=2782012 RepID=UPI001A974D04|nr:hypothetical protein [Bacillus sp. SD088]MBO0991840.1 hypothetical protein [Bacillus sp. SD088]